MERFVINLESLRLNIISAFSKKPPFGILGGLTLPVEQKPVALALVDSVIVIASISLILYLFIHSFFEKFRYIAILASQWRTFQGCRDIA